MRKVLALLGLPLLLTMMLANTVQAEESDLFTLERRVMDVYEGSPNYGDVKYFSNSTEIVDAHDLYFWVSGGLVIGEWDKDLGEGSIDLSLVSEQIALGEMVYGQGVIHYSGISGSGGTAFAVYDSTPTGLGVGYPGYWLPRGEKHEMHPIMFRGQDADPEYAEDPFPGELVWEVKGGTDPTTVIDADGILTIGLNEKATELTMVATAPNSISGEASVEPVDPAMYFIDENNIRITALPTITDNTKEYIVRANGEMENFVKVTLVGANGKVFEPIVEKDVVITEGSTIMTFKPEFLKTLENGNYAIAVEYVDEQYARAMVSVNIATPMPANPTTQGGAVRTSDGNHVAFYLFLAALGIIGIVVARTKMRTTRG